MQNHQSLTPTGFPEFNVQFPEHEQLKCPRCDSSNTKFCYYNNYNLSQPRHFCKNCRRYWTKGGTLRNIPVGGGCRKNSKRPSAAVITAASIPSRQQLHEKTGVQNSSTLTVSASSDLGSGVVHSQDQSQNPSLKAEPGQIPGVGSGSDGAVESFTSLLGLDSEGQFGNFLEGFSQNREKTGLSDGSSHNTGQASGNSSNGFMVSGEANYWASNNTTGYKLQ